MKLALKNIILTVACLFFISASLTQSAFLQEEQVHLVQDNSGVRPELQTVVTRQPTISAVVNNSARRIAPQSNVVYASNSNFSNAPNVGSYGKTATIVGPHIVFHSKKPVSVVESTPVHLGERVNTQTILAANLKTGEVEGHELTTSTPIIGDVQTVKTAIQEDKRSLDLNTKKFGPILSKVTLE